MSEILVPGGGAMDGYPVLMDEATARSRSLRAMLRLRSDDVLAVASRYGASNPRVFGSVARGDAGPNSDIDIIVDLGPGAGNPLLAVAGISDELGELLGVRVDVVCDELLRDRISDTAHAEAVAL
ncbi:MULTISPECIES: nucleotidyltransferase family protein [Prauserella salsuginis group]|uniref:Polymerase nucleotidyl transferase domain-containing protein n=2 Tax=Prauserella salsuginis group TaxID=2893672 RepID=A0A839XIX5_9PSEU|nr:MULTISPECIES: nucleotidyltransferase family protein [Prauserella salsuginis group]MBB3661514.1 hypothetical protein [Prauserella sediminis]MCR3719433.1 hypothetical protein [Prauserella flava]MCR3735553.1 hypothetical protein [Prauserella salsuginis]